MKQTDIILSSTLMNAPTTKDPDQNHLTMSVLEHVYEPSEDTFLLMDALTADAERLRALQPAVSVEIGSGNGVPISKLALLLGRRSGAFFATDINPHAAATSARTFANNGILGEVVLVDALDGFKSRFHGAVDVLLFNPPYVPTPTDEIGGAGIEASWAGGVDGREVIDRILPMLPRLLSPTGVG